MNRILIIASLLILGCGGKNIEGTASTLKETPKFIVTSDGGITDAFPESSLELTQPVSDCVAPDINPSSFTTYAVSYAPAMPPQTFSTDGGISRVSERTADILVPIDDGGAKLLPAVIEIHGGAWEQGHIILSDIQQIATNGYVGVGLNYRLVATTDGGVPTSIENLENIFPADISDVRCAFRFLKKHALEYKIDINRLALLGDSAGGQLSALLASSDRTFNTKFDDGTCPLTGNLPNIKLVIANYGGQFNFLDVEGGTQDAGDGGFYLSQFSPNNPLAVAELFGFYPPQDSPNAKVASPTSHISIKTPPTLLMFGSNDTAFPPSNSTNYYLALREAGIQSTLIELTGLTHNYPMLLPSSEWDSESYPNINVVTCTTLSLFKGL